MVHIRMGLARRWRVFASWSFIWFRLPCSVTVGYLLQKEGVWWGYRWKKG